MGQGDPSGEYQPFLNRVRSAALDDLSHTWRRCRLQRARVPAQHRPGNWKTGAHSGASLPLRRPAGFLQSAMSCACPSLRAYTAHEVGDRLADLMGAVFLDEMAPLHRHFGLVRPGAANFPLPADQDRAWVCINKELRNMGLGKPGRIVFNHLHYIRGLALDRNHAWPCKRGPAVLARISEGPAVSGHLLLTEPAYDGAGQHPFNEYVLFKNHLLAAFGTETLKHTSCILRPVGPSERRDNRFHVNDALHSVAVLVGPVETHCRAPVMEHQDDLFAQADLFPQCKQIAALFGICVTLWRAEDRAGETPEGP